MNILLNSFRSVAILLLTLSVHAADLLENLTAEFDLVNAQGIAVTHADFRGRTVLMAFGFTNCPHICPMMAANMGAALKLSGQDASGIFVSVDTERDPPEVVHRYAQSFGSGMTGLSGSYDQLSAAAKNFDVTFVVTKSEENYTVQHSSNIYLIDADGRVRDVFALNARPEEMADAIARANASAKAR